MPVTMLSQKCKMLNGTFTFLQQLTYDFAITVGDFVTIDTFDGDVKKVTHMHLMGSNNLTRMIELDEHSHNADLIFHPDNYPIRWLKNITFVKSAYGAEVYFAKQKWISIPEKVKGKYKF